MVVVFTNTKMAHSTVVSGKMTNIKEVADYNQRMEKLVILVNGLTTNGKVTEVKDLPMIQFTKDIGLETNKAGRMEFS